MNRDKENGVGLYRDLIAGLVVFLVALPLCLGIAKASGDVPLMSGIIAGIVGGLVVGLLSGSHTSVSGPAAGLTAVVAAQLAAVGSFPAFLMAVLIAGVIQLLMGLAKLGILAAFFPSSVIKGLLAAIGLILILKQIPHLIGHDKDAEGEMSYVQPDHENTFTELWKALFDWHTGPLVVGLASLVLIVAWDRIKLLKGSPIPSALVAVVMGGFLGALFSRLGGDWVVGGDHLVRVPEAGSLEEAAALIQLPDWKAIGSQKVWLAAITIAIVASLETLLNLEAVDRLDPQKRNSPPNRELFSQGMGNITCGLIGGLPVTSVIVRSSVNINAGARTRMSAIVHGLLLLGCVLLIPGLLNRIPLSSLAAVLLVTGYKLANPRLVKQMWAKGLDQFLPFAVTLAAIVFTDLLKGILIGLGFSLFFILRTNIIRPLRKIRERHVGGEVLRIELPGQVNFLDRAGLIQTLASIPRGTHVLLDARNTSHLDHDVQEMLVDFEKETAPAHGVVVSKMGFQDHYQVNNQIQFADLATRELQHQTTPDVVLEILQAGNERFRSKTPLFRDQSRMVDATAAGQFPLAVVLGCIDSRTPAETVFDLGLGEIFSVRIAGNIAGDRELGSLEYACAVAGAKLVVVMGHTRCGAVTSAIRFAIEGGNAASQLGCTNVDFLLNEIRPVVHAVGPAPDSTSLPAVFDGFVDKVARQNVLRSIEAVRRGSPALLQLVESGRIRIVGCMYDVSSAVASFFDADGKPLEHRTGESPTPS